MNQELRVPYGRDFVLGREGKRGGEGEEEGEKGKKGIFGNTTFSKSSVLRDQGEISYGMSETTVTKHLSPKMVRSSKGG